MGSAFEDLRNVKTILNLSDSVQPKQDNRTQELILFGASLEALRDVKEKVERMSEKLSLMDMKNEKEVKEIKKEEKSLLDQIKDLSSKEKEALLEILKPKETIENHTIDESEPLSIEGIAQRKKTMVKNTVAKYGKITSSQLSRVIGLSRTRCNEYLKDLEVSGELTAYTEDKKRYYQIKS